MKPNISVIIPVHNEENVLKNNVKKIIEYLDNHKYDFEILLCDNGSTDKTKIISDELIKKDKRVKYFGVNVRGIGLGLKMGIKNAKFNRACFMPIDMPFGLEVINRSFKISKKYDVIIDSKGHKKSVNNAPFERKILSKIYNSLLSVIFNLKIKDTQGSFIIKTEKIKKFIDLLDSEDAFFEAQLIIYSRFYGLNIIEVPVRYLSQKRPSKVKPLGDGIRMFKQILEEKKKFKKLKNEK